MTTLSPGTPTPSPRTRTSGDVTPPARTRKPSKALTAALRRRDMMIRTGASPENLAVIEDRIAALGGTPPLYAEPAPDTKPEPDTELKQPAVESPLEEMTRLMAARVAVVEAKRARVEALRAALAAAEADLADTVERAVTVPLRDGIVPLVDTLDTEPDTEPEGTPEGGPDTIPVPATEQQVSMSPAPRWQETRSGELVVVTRREDTLDRLWVEVEGEVVRIAEVLSAEPDGGGGQVLTCRVERLDGEEAAA